MIPVLEGQKVACQVYRTDRHNRCSVQSYRFIGLRGRETPVARAAEHLEFSKEGGSYARDGHLGFVILYAFLGQPRVCIADFLVQRTDSTPLIREARGYQDEEDREKHAAAHRRVAAVSNWGELGRSRLSCGGRRGRSGRGSAITEIRAEDTDARPV
jgi:hypothetical protein